MDDPEKLVQRTLAGEPEAWRALQLAVEPTILQIARRHRGLRRRGLADLPDDLAEVRTAALERLARSEFSNLRTFMERSAANASESFDSWLYGVVDFVIREHLRKRFGRAPKAEAIASRPAPSKRDLQSQAARYDDELARSLLHTMSVTAQLTIGQIVAYIDANFTPTEAQALRMYFTQDRNLDEIARSLALADTKSAEKLVRRLVARLRYRFIDTARNAADDDQ